MSEGQQTLGGKLAALTGRSKLAELAIESMMVVFAVLAAFGVEQWREERQLRRFADVARAAVELELGENLNEFREAEPALGEVSELIQRVLQAESEDDPLFADGEIGFSLSLPEISSAAWRAAQASQASPYFDYDWVIRASRVYELQVLYEQARGQLLSDMSLLLSTMSFAMSPLEIKDELRLVHGRLLLLQQVHATVQGELQTLLDDEESFPPQE